MISHPFQSCMQACYECAQACDSCASACLQEPDPARMARCIRLDDECAAMCRVAAQLMSRSSEHADQVCQLCAVACRRCADECRRMRQPIGSTSSAGTHAGAH